MTRTYSCACLTKGETVEARAQGSAPFVGYVTEIMPQMELFWAVSALGERRLIDFRSTTFM